MKSKLYEGITSIEFLGTCADRNNAEIAESMKLIANKKKVHKILKSFGFNGECGFSLSELEKYWNPYKYYINEEYINVVHSDIDHIFSITR